MKITNDHFFRLMEIFGIIGVDIELEKVGSDYELLLTLINTLLKHSHKAQSQIESLLADLTGIDTSNPIGLIKAFNKVKKDEEMKSFFTEVFGITQ